MTTTKNLTGTTIKALCEASDRAALVQHADGTFTAVHHIDGVDLLDTDVVLRHPAREWALDLIALARIDAEEAGTPTRITTLRAAAAALAVDELAEEAAREAVVATPTARPVLAVLRPRGRHAATPTPLSEEAETVALCALLDELEEAGLLRAA